MSFSPAYHLRTNKAVERLLFLELLRKLDARLPGGIGKYHYIGLGGPYLEDFNLIGGTFKSKRMVSLEVKKNVQTRQAINQAYCRIELTLNSTTHFVENYTKGRVPLIVWFDYEWPDWKTQIAESCDLLQKLPPMSIFKITLSGKTDWLGVDDPADPLVGRAKKLTEMFGDYGEYTPAQMNADNICDTLYRILRRAVADAVPDTTDQCVRSLASYRYNDGTPILTVAMIIGPIAQVENVIGQAELPDWPFSDLYWHGPKEIAVPHLSVRERLTVDRLLPDASARTVIRKLKLRLGENYQESLKAVDNYVQFYQHVPQFLRVTV